jgi:hypothetical protein
MSSVFHPQSDG